MAVSGSGHLNSFIKIIPFTSTVGQDKDKDKDYEAVNINAIKTYNASYYTPPNGDKVDTVSIFIGDKSRVVSFETIEQFEERLRRAAIII